MMAVAASFFYCAVQPQTAIAANEPAPTRTETNSIGMELVLLPAGEFSMGGQEPAEELVRAFAAYRRKAEYFQDE